MSGKIPATWVQCEIGHVANVVGGATPASKDFTNFTQEGGIPWLTPADLSGYRQMYIGRGSRNLTRKGFESCSATMIPSCSILFSSRAPVGYVAIAANPVCTSQGFKSFVLPNQLESRFVYYYLRFIKPVAESLATGTTFKELSGMGAGRLPLVVAPFNEQKRIADKLDALLARVDACRERLDRVPAVLKRFRQSVLAAATSGELTADWRDGTASGTERRHSTVGALLFDIRYGTAKKCLYEPRTTPVLRIPNIIDGRVNHEDMKYAEFVDSELHRLALLAGDILVIRSNGSLGLVGRTAIVSDREAGFLYAGYLIRLRVNQALAQPAYVSLALSSPKSRDAIELVARSTSGVNNINTDEIKALTIPLPALEEQSEIVRRVEALFACADRLEARYSAARAQVDRLTPALLAKAFRGELVPQDPDDEPASVLLERIRAARATVPPKPRSRQGTGRPTKTQKAEILMLNRRDILDAHLCTILRERGPLTAEALWSASQLDIDDFYDQLKNEEARGLLKEQRSDSPSVQRLLAAA